MGAGNDCEALRAELKQLREEFIDLRADYEQLALQYDAMGQGYEDAVMLYDRVMESSRMKMNFIKQISHEIRTPLNILSGFTQILTTPDLELDESTRQQVSRGIADNTTRITSLVNKMLELAEAGTDAVIDRTDTVPAVQIAAQAAEDSLISEARHVSFDLQTANDGDSAMLQTNLRLATRALTLLLDNAQKFTRPPEASQSASAAPARQEHVTLRVERTTEPPTQVRFIVEDTGVGIPANESEHIFEEFVQLNDYYDGTGIGLTIARSIARRLGGDIVLDTSYTDGARFIYTLPKGE